MIFRIIITAVIFFFVYRFLERLFGSGRRHRNVPTPQPPPRAANPEKYRRAVDAEFEELDDPKK